MEIRINLKITDSNANAIRYKNNVETTIDILNSQLTADNYKEVINLTEQIKKIIGSSNQTPIS